MALPFDIEAFRFAVRRGRIEWHSHALERMVQRGILRSEVKEVLLRGEIIEEYPKDYPLPSALFFGEDQRPAIARRGSLQYGEWDGLCHHGLRAGPETF